MTFLDTHDHQEQYFIDPVCATPQCDEAVSLHGDRCQACDPRCEFCGAPWRRDHSCGSHNFPGLTSSRADGEPADPCPQARTTDSLGGTRPSARAGGSVAALLFNNKKTPAPLTRPGVTTHREDSMDMRNLLPVAA